MNAQLSRTVFQGMTILVVDDEPDNVGVLLKLLTLLGAEVVTASDGQEGLDSARGRQPHVIFADLSMPKMSGWEMLYNLKQDAAIRDIPVIAFTAHAMAGDRERILEAGFVSYIPKPIDVPKFIPTVISILQGIPQTASHFAKAQG